MLACPYTLLSPHNLATGTLASACAGAAGWHRVTGRAKTCQCTCEAPTSSQAPFYNREVERSNENWDGLLWIQSLGIRGEHLRHGPDGCGEDQRDNRRK